MGGYFEKTQTLVRPSPVIPFVTASIFSMSVVSGVFLLYENNGGDSIVAGVALTISGLGAIAFCLLTAWQPLVVISHAGITIPQLRNASFIEWSNVHKIIVVEQDMSGTIGIFACNPKDIVWASKRTSGAAKVFTYLPESPDLLIGPALSRARVQKIMDVLQSYQENLSDNERQIETSRTPL